MHCINVMTGALGVGKDKGATILIGGHSHLKIGATMGTVIIPFMDPSRRMKITSSSSNWPRRPSTSSPRTLSSTSAPAR